MSSTARIISLADMPDAQGVVGRSILDYEADPTGVTDSTAAIQSALNDQSTAGGGLVIAPTGNYLIGGNLTVPVNVTFCGNDSFGPYEPNFSGGAQPGKKTVLSLTAGAGNPAGTAAITLKTCAGLVGVSLYYPNQSNSAPIRYPYAVRMDGVDCLAQNVALVNVDQFLISDNFGSYRQRIDGVTGQFLSQCILIDGCVDTPILTNIRCNSSAWTDQAGAAWTYYQEQGTFLTLRRVDQFYLDKCYAFRCRVGFEFDQSTQTFPDGVTLGYGTLNSCGADSCGGGVIVNNCNKIGICLSNFVGRVTTNTLAIATAPSFDGLLSVNGGTLGGDGNLLSLQGTAGSQVNLCGVNLGVSGNHDAVTIYGGNLTATGNTFSALHTAGNHFNLIAPGANGTIVKAVMAGNMAVGRAIQIANNIGAAATLTGNA